MYEQIASAGTILGDSLKLNEELEKITNPNKANEDGVTYLILAICNYNVDIVKRLLEKGADPNICDYSGAHPLLFAIMKNDPRMTQIVELLLEYGANPMLRSKGGMSIIEAAEVCMKFDLADRLREIAKKFEEKS